MTDHADFTGRTAAVDSVELRPRVWGYLDKVNFKEGALVKKGDVLFEIDPRPYRAELNGPKGRWHSTRPASRRLERDYRRAKNLMAPGPSAQEEYDRYAGDHREAIGQPRRLPGPAGTSAALNLGYTRVTAPVSGRVSRYVVTVGNLVQSGDQGGGTLLTTIVSVDPMYVYFDVDERTVLRVRELIREGKARSARETEWPVALGLANEEGFPHQGTINFVDNQVNPRTGTLRVRGVFPNKDEVLTPGLFARVRVPIGRAPPPCWSPTVRSTPTRAEDRLRRRRQERGGPRPVRLGALHDGLREVTEGLKAGERVIVAACNRCGRASRSSRSSWTCRPRGSGRSRAPRVAQRHTLIPCDHSPTADLRGGGLSCWPVSSSTARSWRG